LCRFNSICRNAGLLEVFCAASFFQYPRMPPDRVEARDVSSTPLILIPLAFPLIVILRQRGARIPVWKTCWSSSLEKSVWTRKPPSDGTDSFRPLARTSRRRGSTGLPGCAARIAATNCSPRDLKRSFLDSGGCPSGRGCVRGALAGMRRSRSSRSCRSSVATMS